MKFIFNLLLLTSLVNNSKAQCDSTCNMEGICCQNNPVPAGIMISNIHAKGEWMFSYRYNRMYMDNVIDVNSNSVSLDEQLKFYDAASLSMQMKMHMLMGMYGITDRLTAMVMLHYMNNEMKMLMPGSENFHTHTMRTGGIADSRVSFMYALKKRTTEQLVLALGINIPSGSIQEKGRTSSMMYPGKRFPYMMQLGSGTIDPMLTLSYLKSFGKIYFSSQINTIVRAYKNKLGYRLGNEYTLNNWLGWQISKPISISIRMENTLIDKIIGSDSELDLNKEVAANSVNSGGFRNLIFAGLSIQPKNNVIDRFKLSCEFGIPVYQRLNGWQSRNAANLMVALNYNF